MPCILQRRSKSDVSSVNKLRSRLRQAQGRPAYGYQIARNLTYNNDFSITITIQPLPFMTHKNLQITSPAATKENLPPSSENLSRTESSKRASKREKSSNMKVPSMDVEQFEKIAIDKERKLDFSTKSLDADCRQSEISRSSIPAISQLSESEFPGQAKLTKKKKKMAITPDMSARISAIENTTKFAFSNPALLIEALQDKGSGITNVGDRTVIDGNKRLAILGDSVLRLVLVEDWYDASNEPRSKFTL